MKLTVHPLGPDLKQQGGRPIPVDLELAGRLRKSLDQILTRGAAFSATFYDRLFTRYPELRNLFPADMAKQQKKLRETLDWVIDNLDRPVRTRHAIDELGKRHAGYGTLPQHYPIVRDLLVEAMADVSGETWSAGIAGDWTTAITLLCELMLKGASEEKPSPLM